MFFPMSLLIGFGCCHCSSIWSIHFPSLFHCFSNHPFLQLFLLIHILSPHLIFLLYFFGGSSVALHNTGSTYSVQQLWCPSHILCSLPPLLAICSCSWLCRQDSDPIKWRARNYFLSCIVGLKPVKDSRLFLLLIYYFVILSATQSLLLDLQDTLYPSSLQPFLDFQHGSRWAMRFQFGQYKIKKKKNGTRIQMLNAMPI